jgi:hypothetical protein
MHELAIRGCPSRDRWVKREHLGVRAETGPSNGQRPRARPVEIDS